MVGLNKLVGYVLTMIGCIGLAILLITVVFTSNQQDELRQTKTINDISELINQSNLTRSETLMTINYLCGDLQECKMNLTKRFIEGW